MGNMTRRGEPREQGLVRGGETMRAMTDPFRMIRELMGADVLGGLARTPDIIAPDIEVKETKDAFLVRADLPGVQERDIEVDITGNRLTVTGKREEEQRQEGERYFAYERSYGTFSRTLTLPEGVDAERVRADLANGVLEITIPKRAEAQGRKIHVGVGTSETRAAEPKKGPESGTPKKAA
ncbi:heat shock protein, Hsp20 family protein [Minicystis rosea]|nr:heat shock protein, Hsp20 family protein [Minicystis rosea]